MLFICMIFVKWSIIIHQIFLFELTESSARWRISECGQDEPWTTTSCECLINSLLVFSARVFFKEGLQGQIGHRFKSCSSQLSLFNTTPNKSLTLRKNVIKFNWLFSTETWNIHRLIQPLYWRICLLLFWVKLNELFTFFVFVDDSHKAVWHTTWTNGYSCRGKLFTLMHNYCFMKRLSYWPLARLHTRRLSYAHHFGWQLSLRVNAPSSKKAHFTE